MFCSWAIEIQSLAKRALLTQQMYIDLERYERLREIAAEVGGKDRRNVEKVKRLFLQRNRLPNAKDRYACGSYSRTANSFDARKQRNMALPGGWCDVLQSVGSNTVKELKEETGLDGRPGAADCRRGSQ